MEPEKKLEVIIKAWAVTEGLRLSDVAITISGGKVQAAVKLLRKPQKSAHKKTRRSDRPITDEDWKKIMQLPWQGQKDFAALEEVRKTGDFSLPANLPQEQLYNRFNVIFYMNKAEYRFVRPRKVAYEGPKGPYRLVAWE